MKSNYPKFKNQQDEFDFLTKELDFSNFTAFNIVRLKKLVTDRLNDME